MFMYSEEDERKDYEHMMRSTHPKEEEVVYPPPLTSEQLEQHKRKLKEASEALWFRTVARSEAIDRGKKEALDKLKQLLDAESNINY